MITKNHCRYHFYIGSDTLNPFFFFLDGREGEVHWNRIYCSPLLGWHSRRILLNWQFVRDSSVLLIIASCVIILCIWIRSKWVIHLIIISIEKMKMLLHQLLIRKNRIYWNSFDDELKIDLVFVRFPHFKLSGVRLLGQLEDERLVVGNRSCQRHKWLCILCWWLGRCRCSFREQRWIHFRFHGQRFHHFHLAGFRLRFPNCRRFQWTQPNLLNCQLNLLLSSVQIF